MGVVYGSPIALHTDGHIWQGCSLSFSHYFAHLWPHFTCFFVIFPLFTRWWPHFIWLFFVICPLLYTLMATFYMVVLCHLSIALHTDGRILHGSLLFAHWHTHWWPHFAVLLKKRYVKCTGLHTHKFTFYSAVFKYCHVKCSFCVHFYDM